MARSFPRGCGPFHTFFFATLSCAPKRHFTRRWGSAAGRFLLAGLLALAACLGSAGLPPPLEEQPLDPATEQAARETYNRGVTEAEELRYELAYAAFDSVVERYPGSRYSAASLRQRGIAAYRLGRHAEATADLRRVLEHAPDYETTDTAIVLASALQRGGDSEGALRALVRYLPERDSGVDGARIVVEAATRGLRPGAAGRLAAELPERIFLASLFARAAEETRASDPEGAAALQATAERLAAARLAGRRPPGDSARDLAPAGGGSVVGAILPEGGRLGPVAQEIQDGARLALEELATGGGPRYLLEVMPEGGAGGASASLNALADRGVRVVIGPLESEAVRSTLPVARDRGLLVVSPTATESTLLGAAPWVVTLNATSGELGAAMGDFAARDMGILRVAVIGADDEYGRTHAREFSRAFGRLGGEVVVERLYPHGTTNFGGTLRAARLKGAQALFLPTRSADQILTVLSQMEYYSGGSFQMLGTEVWRDERFLERAGRFAEGAYFADTFSPDSRVTRYWDFRTEYFKRYGQTLPSNFPAWGYDAVILALRYLTRVATPGAETTHVGAAATYVVRDGAVRKLPVISRIEGGSPQLARILDRVEEGSKNRAR